MALDGKLICLNCWNLHVRIVHLKVPTHLSPYGNLFQNYIAEQCSELVAAMAKELNKCDLW